MKRKMKLKNEDLQEIYGGASTGLLILGVIALATLIAGIIDGYTRPLSCHE